MAINILVIDDDRKMAERLMRGLQRADKENILGEIQVDDSVIKLETVENYDISHFETTFDVALIDYQLSSSFTGILVSAWIALYLQIPRLTLTTASYPGNPAYFNGSILKNEITDSPEVVIQRILECVENYNAELWLAKQHQELVAEYQHMLHTIIQVDLDVLVSEVVNLFLVLLQLCRLILELLLLFGQLHALGCAGMVNGVTELGKLGAITLLLFMYIVGAQAGEKITLIAVHIAQCFETVLFAAVKEPVDRTLLIGFQVVGIEVVQEVAADHLAGRTLAAERVGNKL